MNLHAVQTFEAMEEVKTMLSVKACMMNPQTNTPSIGMIMDNIVSAYLLSHNDSFVDPDTFNDAMMMIGNTDGFSTLNERLEQFNLLPHKDNQGKLYIPGKVLFSATLPSDFNYQKGEVIIMNGILVSGIVKSTHIGTAHNSILQALHHQYGPDRAIEWLDDTSFVLHRYLADIGFSVGLGDCFPESDEVKKIVESAYTKATMFIESLGDRPKDPVELNNYENQIKGILNFTKTLGSQVSQKALSSKNRLRIMADSGAKGTLFNISQITALTGQSYITGERPAMEISGGTRCLPYFEAGSTDPASRGFCSQSFLTGISLEQFWFMAMAGREGLLDTAVKTKKTGELQRNLIKSLENIRTWEDGTVRDNDGVIIETLYGGDSFDPSEMINTRTLSGDALPFFINIDATVMNLNAKYGYFLPEVKTQIDWPSVDEQSPLETSSLPPLEAVQISLPLAKTSMVTEPIVEAPSLISQAELLAQQVEIQPLEISFPITPLTTFIEEQTVQPSLLSLLT